MPTSDAKANGIVLRNHSAFKRMFLHITCNIKRQPFEIMRSVCSQWLDAARLQKIRPFECKVLQLKLLQFSFIVCEESCPRFEASVALKGARMQLTSILGFDNKRLYYISISSFDYKTGRIVMKLRQQQRIEHYSKTHSNLATFFSSVKCF